MAKLGTITLTGETTSQYVFNVWDRSDKFKAVGGLYFLTIRKQNANGTGSHTFIYIGETEDLSRRPFNHHRKPCFDRHGANSVLIYVEESRDKRLKIETDLRRAYDPPCNRQ